MRTFSYGGLYWGVPNFGKLPNPLMALPDFPATGAAWRSYALQIPCLQGLRVWGLGFRV